MFSFSKKSVTATVPNKIWKTKEQCLRGVGTAAMQRQLAKGTVVVIAFFEDEVQKCADFFSVNNIPFQLIAVQNGSAFSVGEINVCLSYDILSSPQLLNAAQSPTLFVFLGHYPIASTEVALLEKLPLKDGNAAFYLSMEDEFLKVFGMEKMIGLMEQLGLKDDESVEHRFVDKAIVNAQKKLAEKKSDFRCRSEAEWFQRNIHSRI